MRVGTGGQECRRRDIAQSGAPSCYALRDYSLICGDVVRGHVLDGDLLLGRRNCLSFRWVRQKHWPALEFNYLDAGLE
jgi:hypothetical protein